MQSSTGRVYSRGKIVRSEGQRMLLDVPGTLQQIGTSVGATKQAVSLWRDGARTPDEQARRALSLLYAIPIDAWGHAPARGGGEPGPEPPHYDDLDDAADGPEPSVLDDCLRLLRTLRRELNRTDLLARERAQLTDAFARAVTQKAKMEREIAMREDRTIREHPKWRRLKKAMIAALVAHPAAARDLEAAIARVIGAEDPDVPPDVE